MPAWLKTVLKWSGLFILALVLLAGGVFVAAYALNAHDEELSAQAKAFVLVPPNGLEPEDNLFLSLVGLAAPSGTSTTLSAQAILERHERAAPLVFSNPDEYQRLTAVDGAGLRFAGKAQFCRAREGSVWGDAPAHEAEIARLREDNAALYQRYLALPQRKGFYDVGMPRAQVPFFPPGDLRCLFLADVALRLRSDSPATRAGALGALVRDIGLWRTVLDGQGDLISKMLPVSYLHADYLLLADALADPAFTLPEARDGDDIVPLFELAAWDIGNVFPVELRFYLKTLSYAAQEEQSRFYQPNATANLRAARLAQLTKLAAPDPKNYAALASLENESRVRAWHLYNPIGQVLESIATVGTLSDYLLRAWDGAALQRLVRLGYEIRRQNIGPDAIAAFMQAHPELATHPGDGRAFEYDPGTHELRLHPLSKQAKDPRRYAIPVWQAPAA